MHPSISDGSLSSKSFRRQIEAVKNSVRIEDVAAHYGEFRPTGPGRSVGRCVSPEHEDRTPSMTIYADDQRFKCYGCGEHGDVIDLVMLAEPGVEVWEAMLTISTRHGIELPLRPPSWFARQRRRAPVRATIERQRVEHVRLLVFRLIWMPWLRRLPEDVRVEATEGAWRDSLWIADRIYSARRSA